MWRTDAVDVFGIFAGIILGLGFFALVAYLVYLFIYKRIQMKHETRLEMIKQGLQVTADNDTYGSLKAGIVSAAVGLGLLVGMVIHASSERDPVGGEVVIALVPLFVGLGLVLFHLFWGNRSTAQIPGKD